jgi:hypothetical protein
MVGIITSLAQGGEDIKESTNPKHPDYQGHPGRMLLLPSPTGLGFCAMMMLILILEGTLGESFHHEK